MNENISVCAKCKKEFIFNNDEYKKIGEECKGGFAHLCPECTKYTKENPTSKGDSEYELLMKIQHLGIIGIF